MDIIDRVRKHDSPLLKILGLRFNSSYFKFDISCEQALLLLEKKDLVVIDVRTEYELKEEKSIIKDVLHIDYRSEDFEEKINKLDKEIVYLVICKSGVRGGAACNKMSNLGFNHIYNLKGGINSLNNSKY